MTDRLNALGQPIGPAVPDWTPPLVPPRTSLFGRFCRLEPLSAEVHASDLYEANREDAEHRIWTYLFYGPFDSLSHYTDWVEHVSKSVDPLYFAIVDAATGKAVGVASYLRIDPANGVVEVGHIVYSPRLQRTPAATEAMFLMMEQAFTLGYRRYEWKCDALNEKSRAAAQRLGFSFEGVFRQAVIYKGRSRDTAWYSIIDSEWPCLRAAFRTWLDPSNFDKNGRQRERLSTFTSAVVGRSG